MYHENILFYLHTEDKLMEDKIIKEYSYSLKISKMLHHCFLALSFVQEQFGDNLRTFLSYMTKFCLSGCLKKIFILVIQNTS